MHYLLFTTTTCPKCPAVKEYVSSQVRIHGKIVDNTHPGFLDLAAQYGVSLAPTMLVFDQEREVFRGNEVGEIREFVSTLSPA